MNDVLISDQGPLRWIEIHRPDQLNAWNLDTVARYREVVQAAVADEKVAVIGLRGSQKAFGVGADMAMFDAVRRSGRFEPAFDASRALHAMMRDLEEAHKPVLAAIRGICVGGGLELALSADLRFATSSATFGFPEVNIGVIPGAGGTARLRRHLPADKAKWLLWSGERLTAAQAHDLGLVTEVWPEDQLSNRVQGLADTLASKPPLALAMSKLLLQRGQETTVENLERMEAMAAGILLNSHDHHEGVAAFREKREPVFEGRWG